MRHKPKIHRQSSTNSASSGQVRIIGGMMRGRKLNFSTVEGLRPTMDRIRETVFNWLAADIANAECLDLFAGSGALSFEAASRGASRIVMVERSAKVAKDLAANCQLLSLSNSEIKNMDAENYLTSHSDQFDLIFLDPPFGKGMLAPTLAKLSAFLKPHGKVYIEQAIGEDEVTPDESWQQLKYKKTASFSYSLYQKDR